MKGDVCAACLCQGTSHQCFSSGVMGDGTVSGHGHVDMPQSHCGLVSRGIYKNFDINQST